MKREFTYAQSVRRSLIKTYRKSIWNSFVEACKNYRLVNDGDMIMIYLENDASSVLTALLFEQLKRISETDFEYAISAQKDVDLSLFELDATVVNDSGEAEQIAKEKSFNKLAVSTNMNDVVNTVIYNLFYGSSIRSVLPKETQNGIEIIRPLFCVYERDIDKWKAHNGIELVTNKNRNDELSKLVEEIRKINPDIEHNAFTSVQNVKLDTINGYIKNGEKHSFLEKY